MVGSNPVRWRDAWQAALYGPGGFYRSGGRPAAHFRTSVHASPLFAHAVLHLVRLTDLAAVIDVGAGGGELLGELHRLDPDLRLYGVDVASRPPGLPSAIEWSTEIPAIAAVLVANEWLDNVPCDVVESTDDGPRLVLVDPATGEESIGDHPEPHDAAWLDRWWPLREPGHRGEVGRSRDEAWCAAVSRLTRGLAVAIDYCHTRDTRPAFGTLTGYRHGRLVAPVPDGTCDITAHVALDSCAIAAPGPVLQTTQRAALRALGVTGRLPAYELAATDSRRYVAELAAANQAAELTNPRGLGDFGWLIHAVDVPLPDFAD